jgi:hypothetical protein
MEPLRKCQIAKQYMPVENNQMVPCEDYPNCPHCPINLSESPRLKVISYIIIIYSIIVI